MGKSDHLSPISEQFFNENDFNMEELEQILNSLKLELERIRRYNKTKV